MIERYPSAADFPADEDVEREIAWMQSFVLAVRQIRGEMNIAPSRRIPVLLRNASTWDLQRVERFHTSLVRLAGLESIKPLQADEAVPQSATALIGELTVLVPMAGLIDAAAEAQRLEKVVAKNESDLRKTQTKLANDNFVRNAPEDVVKTERERAEELERTLTSLKAQLERVRRLIQP